MFLLMVMIYAVTVLFFVIMLNEKDKQFAEERKDYLNRLMAKNPTEYIKLSKKEEPRIITDGEILGNDLYNDRVNGILN